MTIQDIEERILKLEKELKDILDGLVDSSAYLQGIDARRLEIESELEQLRKEIEKLKKLS